MIMTDQKDSTTKECQVADKFELVKKFWAGFHNSVIIALIFTFLGAGIGIHICKEFYTKKLDEVVATGAMLHKSKVYTISPKI